MATIVITTATALVNLLTSAIRNNKGQFATITYNAKVALLKYPNDSWCKDNGVVLATGKGSRTANEQYRINEEFSATRSIRVQWHIGYNYAKALAKVGGTPSVTPTHTKVRIGGGVSYNTDTCVANFGFVLANYAKGGEIFVGGTKATPADLAYIAKYRPTATPKLVDYRQPNLTDIKEIRMGGDIYLVDIKDLQGLKIA